MFGKSKEQTPHQEQGGEKASIKKFLVSWYENIAADRQLLCVLEAALNVMDATPTNQPISLDQLSGRLSADKGLSVHAKELIPMVIARLSAVERGEDIEVPAENHAYRTTLLKEIEAYSSELLNKYHNEEQGFDVGRAEMLDLIYAINDEEQTDYAFIERRATTWPTIIRPRVIERAKADKRFSGKDIVQIVDEVLPELHRRTLNELQK